MRVLRYFLAVARRQNITRAAEDLRLTQSTLSRQLAELEEELGTQLLERGKRRTTLTEAGLALKPRAEEIIALTERTLAQFVGGDSPVAGDVWLGCAEAAGMGDLAAALAPLRAAYPGIKLHLLSGNEGQIVDRLRSGLLDFGLVCRDARRRGQKRQGDQRRSRDYRRRRRHGSYRADDVPPPELPAGAEPVTTEFFNY